MDDLGTFAETPDGRVTLRYERWFSRPIETVWAALTQPERLADWLGPCEVEPRIGGRFNVFVGNEGRMRVYGHVLAWQPPALLSFTWNWNDEPETVVRWELDRQGPQATRLVFTHEGLVKPRVDLVLPGWHVYLERLGELMRGTTPERDHRDRWREVQIVYQNQYRL